MSQPSNKSAVSAAYDEWAETYDTDPNRTREMAGEILRRVDLQVTGRNVIEIGCGTGYNTEWLAERAGSVIALDFSEGMLRQAMAHVSSPRVRFMQQDVCSRWPVASASANLIVGMLILEHVEKIEPVFAEAARTLSAGGELFLCELHPMRQLLGKQAEFTNRKTGEHRRVPAFLHNVSDYLKVGLLSGFELVSLDEWRDDDAPHNSVPRLLSLQFRIRKDSQLTT